ncbi:hypothetical protein ATEG_09993 [Aspergillus terreus NIH2624]|uniref:Glucose-methanol-choline oxidoreductase N-terminal domain-containing protein n=1 Tax=Aspergillus terreus (strain NIH 2624 / FGSC A1156) TaxID=341663 RepID=Q0C8J1_ASPTN|nr:uncharacterized protein ATEG_09993 [Aspergillus terreus NIH2624]EAU29442.1 hypothetical protein ATEG_09993 [Aspergillus terreus NIH2624]
MGLFVRLFGTLLAASTVLQPCLGQSGTPVVYTDPDTGIVFDTWKIPAGTVTGGMTFGVALPSDALTTDATEFIGYLECALDASAGGWCGLSLGGSMTSNLLFMAYPYEDTVLTSLRFASGYVMPDVYAGNATVTQISSTVNSTHFTLLFRCEGCLSWNHNGQTGSASTSAGRLVLGWAQATESPTNPSCPDDISLVQHDSGSIWVATLDKNAASASYEEWTALANKTVPGDCSGDGGGGSGPEPVPVPDGAAYDYIIVGGGAGGLPLADRLSEAGHKVLLIEKGPPSSGRWGGTMKPAWLDGTNLTRFDVPGLCNQIWHDSTGIACDGVDQMAGCVLGGGTAVNAGLWWRPYPLDWDVNFPSGWQSGDMLAATNRVFSRIPGTITPSTDSRLYLQQGANVLSNALLAGGYRSLSLNDNPDQKNHTLGHTPYMFSHGERGGPLATYLVSASGRDNFDLWLNTTVKRVNSSDGETMIEESQWIELPVGENLIDHTNTDLVFTHPDVVFYDFYAAWDSPIETDAQSYLNNRAGILAQSAPNIGPIFFDEVTGSDGVTRQLQWTARMEGSHDIPDGHAITVSQYLGRGMSSRGRMTLSASLDTTVSTLPWLRDQADVDAVIKGIENLKARLSRSNVTWAYPASNVSIADFVNDLPITASTRRANHWMGTCKLGTDDGRNGGTSVVDLNTKVYGMDNLFVVDASIFPGMVTTNPSAYIVTVSEHAADKILAL